MIGIYGATGHVGKRVAEALEAQGLDFVLIGRNQQRLEEAKERFDAPIRTATIEAPNTLTEAFSNVDVVVNCAGPFFDTGEIVLRSALDADCHYLDTSGEQGYVRRIYEHFEAAARKAQRVVVNACAFEAALGDWAGHVVARALGCDVLDSLHISYAIENLPPTSTTHLSFYEAVTQTGCKWLEDRWVTIAAGSEQRVVPFPRPFETRTVLSFPAPEVISLPRHVSTKMVQTYLSLGADSPLTRLAGRVAPLVAPVVSPLLAPLLRSPVVAQPIQPSGRTPGPDISADPDPSRFSVVAEAIANEQRVACSISGEGIYEVSAGIIALAAERLQNEGSLSGVLAPSELLFPQDALEEIAEQHDLLLEFS